MLKSSTGFSVVSPPSTNIELKPSERGCVSKVAQDFDSHAYVDITTLAVVWGREETQLHFVQLGHQDV